MEDKTYNGWTNYETWAVGMFLDGNYDGEGLYREAQELIEGFASLTDFDSLKADPNIWTLEEARKFRLGEALKDFTEERVTSEEYDGLRGDLLGAALSEVNWDELAENKLSAFSET